MSYRLSSAVTALVSQSLLVQPREVPMPGQKVSGVVDRQRLVDMGRHEVVKSRLGAGSHGLWRKSGLGLKAFDRLNVVQPLLLAQITPRTRSLSAHIATTNGSREVSEKGSRHGQLRQDAPLSADPDVVPVTGTIALLDLAVIDLGLGLVEGRLGNGRKLVEAVAGNLAGRLRRRARQDGRGLQSESAKPSRTHVFDLTGVWEGGREIKTLNERWPKKSGKGKSYGGNAVEETFMSTRKALHPLQASYYCGQEDTHHAGRADSR